MAERSGFYPSNTSSGISNIYTGYEMGKLYKHIITNGVFATPSGTPSDYLQVVTNTGLTVKLKAGSGIFFDQWYESDADINFTLDSQTSLNRIDLIVIEANKNPTILKTQAKVVKGTAATHPVAPTPIDTEYVKQYPVAKIFIGTGVAVLTQSNITDLRGIAPTLWVTSLIKQVDTSTLYAQWTDAFTTWFNNVKDTLAAATLIRKYTGYTNSTTADQTVFTVPIAEYTPNLDILQVHTEGRILRQNVDYTIDFANKRVTLTTGLQVIGTLVYFEAFKSVDGSDAETYVARLYALEERVDASQVTADDGSYKVSIVSNFETEIVNAGMGFHTVYVPATVADMPLNGKSWRGFSSFGIAAAKGYVLMVSDSGDAFAKIYMDGVWTLWRKIYESSNSTLWVGTAWLSANQTVAPSKTLSSCANGWVLTFSAYRDGAFVNDFCKSITIPKTSPTGANWSGEYVSDIFPYEFSVDGQTKNFAFKRFRVYNDRIVGEAQNYTITNYTIGLRMIKEF